LRGDSKEGGNRSGRQATKTAGRTSICPPGGLDGNDPERKNRDILGGLEEHAKKEVCQRVDGFVIAESPGERTAPKKGA